MIYKIPDILNRIEWDGVSAPLVHSIRFKKLLRPHPISNTPNVFFYNMVTTDHRRVAVTVGRLIFMLRTGCTLRQCQEFKVQTDKNGILRDYRKSARPFDFFKNMSEIKETVRIIEDLSRGDSSSFHALFIRGRRFLEYSMFKLHGLKGARFNELFDEALENTEARLREFRFRTLRKIHSYFITEMALLFKGPNARRHCRLPRNITG